MSEKTKRALLDAGRQLFGKHGFQATTVRMLTAEAKANIGAIDYHFGSKEGLYHAVIDEVTGPIRQRMTRAVETEGSALDRLQSLIRATFAFLAANDDVPGLVLQQLVTGTHPPTAAHETLKAFLEQVQRIIVQGQRDGSIRDGNAQMMALSFFGQPMFLTICSISLRTTGVLDLSDPQARQAITESVVTLVTQGVAA